MSALYKDQAWLTEQYVTLKKTSQEIAELCDEAANAYEVEFYLEIYGLLD